MTSVWDVSYMTSHDFIHANSVHWLQNCSLTSHCETGLKRPDVLKSLFSNHFHIHMTWSVTVFIGHVWMTFLQDFIGALVSLLWSATFFTWIWYQTSVCDFMQHSLLTNWLNATLVDFFSHKSVMRLCWCHLCLQLWNVILVCDPLLPLCYFDRLLPSPNFLYTALAGLTLYSLFWHDFSEFIPVTLKGLEQKLCVDLVKSSQECFWKQKTVYHHQDFCRFHEVKFKTF